MALRSLAQCLVAAFLLCAPLATAFPQPQTHIQYSMVTGYFLQDENSTDPSTFDYTATNFGLINQSYPGVGGCSNDLTQWQQFAVELSRLNQESPKNVEYKLLFLGRHGEGWHNAAEDYYGTPAWNCYWAELNGNATASWEDANLTTNGVIQAQTAHNFWAHEMAVQKIQTPDSYYVSPLTRCLVTAAITFDGLDLPRQKPFIPTVKEYLREGISIHTCDHRSNKTYIEHSHPSYRIESHFSEFDELWNGITMETSDAQNLRSQAVLDDIFSSDPAVVISITSHSGEIGSILDVLGHIPFSLNTGAIIPVLVRAEALNGALPPESATWAPSPHCTSPPITSISNGACVCQASATPVTSRLVTETPVVSPIVTFVPTSNPNF